MEENKTNVVTNEQVMGAVEKLTKKVENVEHMLYDLTAVHSLILNDIMEHIVDCGEEEELTKDEEIKIMAHIKAGELLARTMDRRNKEVAKGIRVDIKKIDGLDEFLKEIFR